MFREGLRRVDYLGESLSVKFQQQSLLIPLVHTGKDFFKFVQKYLILDTYYFET